MTAYGIAMPSSKAIYSRTREVGDGALDFLHVDLQDTRLTVEKGLGGD